MAALAKASHGVDRNAPSTDSADISCTPSGCSAGTYPAAWAAVTLDSLDQCCCIRCAQLSAYSPSHFKEEPTPSAIHVVAPAQRLRRERSGRSRASAARERQRLA